MTTKTLPFNLEQIKEITKKYSTPFVIYDKKWIVDNMNYFKNAFSILPWFKNYFAVKACPNPSIINILKDLGSWTDCSSMWELVMSEKLWITWENIMFTSNDTVAEEFKKAHELWAIINFDDITHIEFYKKNIWSLPKIACCRFNPGPLKEGNTIIWKPEESKYGMTKKQILEAYKILKDNWVSRFWLHTMVASNELNPDYFVETAKILFELITEIEKDIWIEFEFVNLWWGIWIPYKPEQTKVDLVYLSKEIKKTYEQIFWTSRKNPLNIVMECGRMVTWSYWFLISEVIHLSKKYKNYVWLDASMQCLMRPALYWAYHYITVLWKENLETDMIYDVTWSLCENNDKFAIDRELPQIDVGDLLAIHDAWAHGTAMWFNYNAKLRPKELLLDENWNVKLIRRAESLNEYFSTINWIDGFEY